MERAGPVSPGRRRTNPVLIGSRSWGLAEAFLIQQGELRHWPSAYSDITMDFFPRRRWRGRIIVASVVAACLGVVAVVYFVVVAPLLRQGTTSTPSTEPSPSASASPLPGC